MRDTFTPLLQFFIATGEVTGRKKCQKMIHILQECGHDFGFDFKLALYGAYSSALQSELETFVENNYIKESTTYSDTLKYPTSHFVPNKRSASILTILGESGEPEWSDLARKLNKRPTRELEATSTILYLRRAGILEEHLESKFKALKPHLMDIYSEGFKLAEELKLTVA